MFWKTVFFIYLIVTKTKLITTKTKSQIAPDLSDRRTNVKIKPAITISKIISRSTHMSRKALAGTAVN